MIGSFMGRGYRYITLFKILHCKLPTIDEKYHLSHLGSGVSTADPTGGRQVCGHCITVTPLTKFKPNFQPSIIISQINRFLCLFQAQTLFHEQSGNIELWTGPVILQVLLVLTGCLVCVGFSPIKENTEYL